MLSLRGQLLVAGPGLDDPNFHRTVLLLGEHGEDGAMGVVLNRQTSVTVADAAGLATTRTFRVTVNAVNVAFTTWTFEMYADPETAVSRSLLGFTLQNDAEDQPDAFDSLL